MTANENVGGYFGPALSKRQKGHIHVVIQVDLMKPCIVAVICCLGTDKNGATNGTMRGFTDVTETSRRLDRILNAEGQFKVS